MRRLLLPFTHARVEYRVNVMSEINPRNLQSVEKIRPSSLRRLLSRLISAVVSWGDSAKSSDFRGNNTFRGPRKCVIISIHRRVVGWVFKLMHPIGESYSDWGHFPKYSAYGLTMRFGESGDCQEREAKFAGPKPHRCIFRLAHFPDVVIGSEERCVFWPMQFLIDVPIWAMRFLVGAPFRPS